MSEIPGDLKFLKSHEWARVEGNGRVTIGISDHAQGLLGDLVYVELPNVGDQIQVGNACADVDSDGGVTGSDLGAFFAVFEVGGC